MVILDLGLDVNILTKQTWKLMGKPMLVWSSIQLHLANQWNFKPIGRVSNLVVDIEGMKMHDDFDG